MLFICCFIFVNSWFYIIFFYICYIGLLIVIKFIISVNLGILKVIFFFLYKGVFIVVYDML